MFVFLAGNSRLYKKVIALAVAALASSAAFAQTNVTVYGVVDVQQAWVKSSGAANGGENQASVGRLDAHGNYIGFKGVEDLGNGLKALFLYETALYADTGAGLTGGRDAYVGLTGGFGTAVAGNLTHPLRAFGAKVELLPGAAGFGTMASVTGTIAGLKTGADERASNAIAYVSPSFSGFSVTAAYVNGENKTKGDQGSFKSTTTSGITTVSATGPDVNARQYQLAAQYENGPLFVGAGYHKAKNFALSAGEDVLGDDLVVSGVQVKGLDARVIRLAAAYTFPTQTKVTALYDNTKVETGDAAALVDTDYLKRQAFSLGVSQEIGKNVLGLEYGRAGKLKVSDGKVDDSAANIWTAMYGYNLSKRTMLHARVSRLSNGDNVNYNYYNLPVSGNGANTGASSGANYTGFSVGLRHSF